MQRCFYKKLDTSGHFRDFWHRAVSRRNDKKIRSRKERAILKRGA